MEKIKLYQIDAFASNLFSGNPAAVCFLKNWLPDDLMLKIANENNLAETAFLVSKGNDYEIRWFTPTTEVDLCGHATLASGYVLFETLSYHGSSIQFYSPRSGMLRVSKEADVLYLDFPTDIMHSVDGMSDTIKKCVGIMPSELYKGKTDYIAFFNNEDSIKNMNPNLSEISKLDARGLIVTSRGDKVDFVSRFFAPQSGINEDPVTGSAYTSLAPLWSKKLGKTKMVALQLSERGGQIFCEYKGERCLIGGKAILYLSGELYLNE